MVVTTGHSPKSSSLPTISASATVSSRISMKKQLKQWKRQNLTKDPRPATLTTKKWSKRKEPFGENNTTCAKTLDRSAGAGKHAAHSHPCRKQSKIAIRTCDRNITTDSRQKDAKALPSNSKSHAATASLAEAQTRATEAAQASAQNFTPGSET